MADTGLAVGLTFAILFVITWVVLAVFQRKKIQKFCCPKPANVNTNVIVQPTVVPKVFQVIEINYHSIYDNPTYEDCQQLAIATNNIVEELNIFTEPDVVSSHFTILKRLVDENKIKFELTTRFANMAIDANKYKDFMPYDQSIVLNDYTWSEYLANPRPNELDSDKIASSYINASYVKMCSYDEMGYAFMSSLTTPCFIATQGCKTETTADFLHMLQQNNVPIIVLLTSDVEMGDLKCYNYWSSPQEIRYLSKCKDCSVKQDREVPMDFGVLRNLTVKCLTTERRWELKHYQFVDWPQKGVPNVAEFYGFILSYMDLVAEIPTGNIYGPHVVQCSTGSRRSGLFICAIFLLEQLRKKPVNLDVIGTILNINRWRMNIITSKDELQFLYEFLQYCIISEGIQFDKNMETDNDKAGDTTIVHLADDMTTANFADDERYSTVASPEYPARIPYYVNLV